MERSEFKTFYNETAPALLSYLIGVCGNADLANDILQETYLRFLQKPPRAEKPEQMRSYLYTIATRLNIDRWKRSKRHEKWLSHFKSEPATSTSDHIDLKTDMSEILQGLKPKERALLLLAYVEEKTHRTIAEIVGIKEKSVRVSLFRARKKLARLLMKQGLSPDIPAGIEQEATL